MKKPRKEKKQSFIRLVTWIVAVIFIIGCVGVIVNFGSARSTAKKGEPPVNPQTAQDEEEINHWKMQVEKNPEDSICLGNLAYNYQKANKLDEAIKYYRLALKYDPGYVFALNNLAKICLSRNNADEAISLWERGLKLEEKNNEFYLGLTLAYMQKKDFFTAGKYVEQLIKIDPGFILAYELKAQILKEEGNASLAIKVLEDAKEIARIKGESQVIPELDEFIKNLKSR